jgi:hypothetical protein
VLGLLRSLFNDIEHSIGAGIRRQARCAATAALFGWMGMVCLVLTFASTAFSAYFYLSLTLPSHLAALWVAAGALFLALLCGLGARLVLGARPAESPPRPEVDPELLLSLKAEAGALEAEAGAVVRRNAKNATIISLVAGLALGLCPELRKALLPNPDSTPRK